MQVTLTIEVEGLGQRIKKEREISGKTPTEIAAIAGMSTANLYRIESEDAKTIPRDTLRRLSEAIGVDFDQAVKSALRQEIN